MNRATFVEKMPEADKILSDAEVMQTLLCHCTTENAMLLARISWDCPGRRSPKPTIGICKASTPYINIAAMD